MFIAALTRATIPKGLESLRIAGVNGLDGSNKDAAIVNRCVCVIPRHLETL